MERVEKGGRVKGREYGGGPPRPRPPTGRNTAAGGHTRAREGMRAGPQRERIARVYRECKRITRGRECGIDKPCGL